MGSTHSVSQNECIEPHYYFMSTLIYNGQEFKRLKKDMSIVVVTKHRTDDITSNDIEEALKRMGFEPDEVQFGINVQDWETPQERESRMQQESAPFDPHRHLFGHDDDSMVSLFRWYFFANLHLSAWIMLSAAIDEVRHGISADVVLFLIFLIGGLYLPLKGLNLIRGGKLSYIEVFLTIAKLCKGAISLKDWWNQYYAPNTKMSKSFVLTTAVLAFITICLSFVSGDIIAILFMVLTLLASPIYYAIF